jgi:hypothetical protein
MTTLEKALMPLIWRTIDLLEKQGGPEVRAIVREITSLLKKKEVKAGLPEDLMALMPAREDASPDLGR